MQFCRTCREVKGWLILGGGVVTDEAGGVSFGERGGGKGVEVGGSGFTRLVWLSQEQRVPTRVLPSAVMMQTFSVWVS